MVQRNESSCKFKLTTSPTLIPQTAGLPGYAASVPGGLLTPSLSTCESRTQGVAGVSAARRNSQKIEVHSWVTALEVRWLVLARWLLLAPQAKCWCL